MFDVFSSERAVKEFVQKDRTFAQKVLDHIKSIIADIKNIFNKLVASGNYDEISAWQSDMEALDKLNNMMLDALAEIEQSKTQAEKNTSEEVKNSKKRNPVQSKYESDVDAVINGTYNSDSALIMGVTPQIYQELGFSKLPIAITKNHVYSIAVTEQQAKADRRYNKNVNYHGLGVQAMKDIYQNISDPIMVIASPDFQSKTQRESVHKVIAIVDLQVGGKQVIAPIEIDAEVENNNFERIDVNLVSSYFDKSNLNKMLSEAVAQESTGDVGFYYVDKNRAKSIFKLAKVQYLGKLDSLNSNGIIHKIDEKVNRKIDDVLKSKQFIRWFGDWQNKPETASKIVNSDGTPKVMYHGTQSSFTAFDKKKAKSSGYYGKGFYFTESESHAKQYGDSMAVYLDVKNPLEPGKNSISKKQLRKFLEAVAENEDDYDIWNYGTDDISEIVDSVYKNDAFAVIQDVNATAIGDFAEAIALFNKVNKTSYDGIITPAETVVYEPTQIKSATDNIGTFDKDNPDIRFSMKRDADYMTAVESGDTETAQKLVDEAAKAAGYTIKAYHGTLSKGFTVFDKSYIGSRFSYDDVGFFFIDRRSIAEDYAGSEFDASQKGTVFETYLKIKNPLRVNKQFCLANGLGNPFRDNDVIDVWDSYSDYIKEEAEGINADGIILDDGMSKMFVVYDSNQIKSADPVTYDDNGNVVPLSQRFDDSKDDIRFSSKRAETTAKNPNGLTENDVKRFMEDAINGNLHEGTYFPARRNTPKILIESALNKNGDTIENLPIIIQVKKATAYGITPEDMIAIIKAMDDPQYIIYQEDNDRYVEVVKYDTSKGSKAVAVLEIGDYKSESHLNGYKGGSYNVLVTAFEPNATYVSDVLSKSTNAVIHEKKKGASQVTSGSTVPSVLNESPFADSITQKQDIVNGDEKFSTKRETSVSEDASNYILDTKEYKEVMKLVDQRYRLTGKKKLDAKAIDRFAGRLLSKSQSQYSREQLTERLSALFDYIANGGN